MSNEIQTKARVQVTIEVEASSWGDTCTIAQVYKQAAEDGLGQIRKMIGESKCRAVILGEPRVIGIITERDSA